jgi:WD40 repeat protein/serine/threonine protein kinase
MTGDESRPDEEAFAAWLANADEAFRVGAPPDEPTLPLPDREQDLAYIQKVRDVFRARAQVKLGAPPLPGGTPLGRFRIRRELGSGGFGVVYLAHDPQLGREVALKVPRPESLLTVDLRARLNREARAAAALQHPNLVPLYEVGEAGPICFLVYAYCPGPTLADWLRLQSQPVPYQDAARLLSILADAVHHAHGHGVVHRDLKPANILLETSCEPLSSPGVVEGTRSERAGKLPLSAFTPKVADFGLAKPIHDSLLAGDSTLTRVGAVVGTASYMAPEQASGRNRAIGPGADIYSLGAILYELLTARPPFQGESDVDTLLLVQAEEVIAPSRLRPKVPRDLETICVRCLEKEPSRRSSTAHALHEDLQLFLAGKPIRARPVGFSERLLRWCRRKPYVAALQAFSALTVIALLGLALAFALHQRNAAREIQKQFELAERRSAQLALDRGLSLCEEGRVGHGMLWLARSLGIAERLSDAHELAWSARANLAHWRFQLTTLRAMYPHAKGIVVATFSPDSKVLLTGSVDGTAQRWEVATGRPVGPPLLHKAAISSLAFSAGGQFFVTGSEDKSAQVWEADSGRPCRPPLLHPGKVYTVAMSPDGQTVITGCADLITRFWDTATGKSLGLPLGKHAEAAVLGFSPDGRTIATKREYGNTIRLWSVASHEPLFALETASEVTSAVFSGDGRTIASGSDGGTIRFWDVDTGKPLGLPFLHPATIHSLVFSPTGRAVLALCGDRTVQSCDRAGSRSVVAQLEGWEGIGGRARFTPDGRALLTLGPVPRLWELPRGKSLIPVLRHPAQVQAVAYSRDGKTVVTGCGDGIARFWDVRTGRLLERSLHHRGRILAVRYSPDGRAVLTASFDNTAQLWDAVTGQPIGPPCKHSRQVNAVAFSPDGKVFVTGSGDTTARFWEVATGRPLGEPLVHQNTVEALAYCPDGRTVLTGAAFEAVNFWDAGTHRLLGSAVYHPTIGVFDLAYSPDGGKILTAGRDMTARLWDANTRLAVSPPLRHRASVASVAFSPDGLLLLTGSLDKTARLWSAATGKPIGPPLSHDEGVMAVAFSPDGNSMLTGGLDNTARLWAVPAPLTQEPERVQLWVELLTGQQLDDAGEIQLLEPDEWQLRRSRLDDLGGTPLVLRGEAGPSDDFEK